MASIGIFTKQDNGDFIGRIETLTLHAPLSIEGVKSKKGDHSPDFRVTTANSEIGAAWSRAAKSGETYLTLTLDDPLFPAPLFCRLVKTGAGRGYSLLWDRARERSE